METAAAAAPKFAVIKPQSLLAPSLLLRQERRAKEGSHWQAATTKAWHPAHPAYERSVLLV